ncbi:MAG: carboxymuconolactone decarboxylase family protein [Elusimicrobia bacterium]|nr:carboxymuconolactone decarboxylase family protein [Elusimicrobiota bacterium]
MQRIPRTDMSKATGRTREQLDAVSRKMGRVPNLHATMANSPAVLTAYLRLNDALSQTSLDNRLRELLAVTVASANDSEYCLSAHTAFGRHLKVDEAELLHAREGASTDPKTLAALTFAKSLVQKRGRVSDGEVSALKAAGFSNAAVLEIVASTVMNIFTNYCNHVAVTEVDFPRVSVPSQN